MLDKKKLIGLILTSILCVIMSMAMPAFIKNRTEAEIRSYIQYPVLDTVSNLKGSVKKYTITNEKYRIRCWIDHYIPYEEDIDTSILVFSKDGVQICGQRNERILVNYFREQFEKIMDAVTIHD